MTSRRYWSVAISILSLLWVLDVVFDSTRQESQPDAVIPSTIPKPDAGASCSAQGTVHRDDRGRLYVCLDSKWTLFGGSRCQYAGEEQVVGVTEWICSKNSGQLSLTWRLKTWRVVTRIPAEKEKSELTGGGDSDYGDYYDGDGYDWWNDYPDDPGWQQYDNGREWVNDPDDTWGDGR